MDEMTLQTPTLLFPAVSLLLLAYTNRFLALSGLIRKLHADYQRANDPRFLAQIKNLRRRVRLVRNMQFCGVFSLLLCTICVFLLFLHFAFAAKALFGISILTMMGSLTLSLWEIQMSVGALDLHLQDLEQPNSSS